MWSTSRDLSRGSASRIGVAGLCCGCQKTPARPPRCGCIPTPAGCCSQHVSSCWQRIQPTQRISRCVDTSRGRETACSCWHAVACWMQYRQRQNAHSHPRPTGEALWCWRRHWFPADILKPWAFHTQRSVTLRLPQVLTPYDGEIFDEPDVFFEFRLHVPTEDGAPPPPGEVASPPPFPRIRLDAFCCSSNTFYKMDETWHAGCRAGDSGRERQRGHALPRRVHQRLSPNLNPNLNPQSSTLNLDTKLDPRLRLPRHEPRQSEEGIT